MCVTEFLRQHNVRQSPPNKKVKGVPELRRSTRHSESVSKSYADDEGDVNFCVIGENNSVTAGDSACLHWVQCDVCNKWRKISGFDGIGELWTCAMNPDCQYNHCAVEEEACEEDLTAEKR